MCRMGKCSFEEMLDRQADGGTAQLMWTELELQNLIEEDGWHSLQ